MERWEESGWIVKMEGRKKTEFFSQIPHCYTFSIIIFKYNVFICHLYYFFLIKTIVKFGNSLLIKKYQI
jgi:hypothetical protein